MTRETFGQIIAVIAEAYGEMFSDQREQVWWALLRELPDEAAHAATLRMCRTSPYPPKPADIFRAIQGDADPERLLDEESDLAIAHLEHWISDHRIVDLGPTLNAVVRAMNGPDAVMARIVGDEWKFERPRFRSLYKAIRRRGVQGDEGTPLIPAVMAENLDRFPLQYYQEHGLPLPVVTAHFELQDVRALPSGVPVVLGQAVS